MKVLHSVFDVFVVLLMMVIMLGGMSYIGGCQANQNGQPTITVQQAAQSARDAVVRAQADVDKFKASIDALQASLAKLPPNAPERKSLEKSLTAVQAVLVRAQFDLDLARIVADAFVPPTTQPK